MGKQPNDSVEQIVTKEYEQFENANMFKAAIKLDKDIKRSVMFENGKQWNMDEDIEEYPKITLNVVKQIGKTRKSNVMHNDYGYLINSTNFASVRKIQDFLQYLSQSVNMRIKDLKALSDDYTKGTSIGYFYWDSETRGFMRDSGGEMRYEVVDIRNFAVANPYIQTIQEQEWVSFVSREKVNSLKEKYGDELPIVSDGNLYTSNTETEPVAQTYDEELVNVYTKFFRNADGQVFFKISTQTLVLKDATPLNPYYRKEDTQEMPNTTSLMDEREEKPDKREGKVWNLYPFARLCLNERDNCFYGYPVIMEYIESQKSINNHFSVYDKALQDNVLGGFVFRAGVLDSKEITTENGQMIELHTMPNENIGNAFQRIPVANVPADSQKYSQELIQTARTVAGVNNVQLGLSDFSGQSGKQTEMLLARAQENASDTAMMFNEFKREQAHIMFLFAKFFYDNEAFVVIKHGYMEDDVTSYQGEEAFDGTKYLDDKVFIDIKVGASPSFSEYSNLEMLGLMVQSGQAPFESYVMLLPDGFISNKQELLKVAKNNSMKVIEQLNETIKQQGMVMEQMVQAYQETQKDRENIDVVVNENERLKSMLADVSAAAIKKVNQSAEQNAEMTAEIRRMIEIVKETKKATNS